MAMVVKDDEGQFKCPCGHTASNKWNVERHMRNCKVVKAAALNVDEAAVTELKESNEAKEAMLAAAKTRIEELTAENASLKAEIKELKARPSTRTTINNNMNITMNIVHLPAVRKIHPETGRATWEPLDVLPNKELVPLECVASACAGVDAAGGRQPSTCTTRCAFLNARQLVRPPIIAIIHLQLHNCK